VTGRGLPVGGVAVALLLIIVVQLVWFFGQDSVQFADGDSFLRLLRVENLLATGDWHDVTIADANAPFGFDLHWSRPFDLMLLLLALPLAPIMGWHEAIQAAGVWISPVLHIATALAMLWALPPLIGRAGACVAAGLTATQISFLSFAVVGRADHHMVFPIVLMLALGFMIRAFDTGERAQAGRAGMTVAFGVWIGPEFMLLMTIFIAVCGVRWLFRSPAALIVNKGFATGLAVGLAVALLLERGGRVLAIEYDRLSLFHVACGAMVLMFWAVVEGISARQPQLSVLRRIIAAAIGTIGIAMVIVLVFPGALGYPFADVDPAFLRIQAAISDYAAATSPRSLLLYLGPVFFALPWACYRALGQDQRWSWFLVLVLLLVFGGFTLGWLRWSLYAVTFSIIVLADLLVILDHRLNARFTSPRRVLIKLPLIIGLIFGTQAMALAVPSDKDTGAQISCPVDALSQWLEKTYPSGAPKTIVAAANFGPELLYKTRHHVLATLSHRNTDGILDGYRMMISADIDAVRAMIELRQIDLIVICPNSGAESYIRRDLMDGALQTRLLEGDLPLGFSEVVIDDQDIAPFRVFRTPYANRIAQ